MMTINVFTTGFVSTPRPDQSCLAVESRNIGLWFALGR